MRYLRLAFALSDAEWRALAAATRAYRRVSVTDGPFAETNEQIGG